MQELERAFPGRVFALVADVTDYPAAPAEFVSACDLLGGLDAIFYSSGILHRVEWEEFCTEKDLEMMSVNALGAVAWLNLAAARFQGTGRGVIIGLGSVAGDRGRGNAPIYNASKAFLHAYLEALRNRLSRHGVRVVTVKPGPVDTPMTAGMSLSRTISAETAARKIIRLAKRNGEFYLSPVHAVVFWVIRRIPSFLFRRLRL